MFQRAGMRKEGLPLPPSFQYLIPLIWRACVLSLVMINSLASKCKDFKLKGFQFFVIKQLKNSHPNIKDLLFWILISNMFNCSMKLIFDNAENSIDSFLKNTQTLQIFAGFHFSCFINFRPFIAHGPQRTVQLGKTNAPAFGEQHVCG